MSETYNIVNIVARGNIGGREAQVYDFNLTKRRCRYPFLDSARFSRVYNLVFTHVLSH